MKLKEREKEFSLIEICNICPTMRRFRRFQPLPLNLTWSNRSQRLKKQCQIFLHGVHSVTKQASLMSWSCVCKLCHRTSRRLSTYDRAEFWSLIFPLASRLPLVDIRCSQHLCSSVRETPYRCWRLVHWYSQAHPQSPYSRKTNRQGYRGNNTFKTLIWLAPVRHKIISKSCYCKLVLKLMNSLRLLQIVKNNMARFLKKKNISK